MPPPVEPGMPGFALFCSADDIEKRHEHRHRNAVYRMEKRGTVLLCGEEYRRCRNVPVRHPGWRNDGAIVATDNVSSRLVAG